MYGLLPLFFVTMAWATLLDWNKVAPFLTGHSESARRRAISQLKNIPDIDDILLKELDGPRRFHALEAISAMGKTEMIPQLESKAVAESTGSIFLTLNSLTTDAAVAQVSRFYTRVWNENRTKLSSPALVVVLDTLGGMRLCLSEKSLTEQWTKRPPEVRSAILDYAKLVKKECGALPSLKSLAEKDLTPKIREEALTL